MTDDSLYAPLQAIGVDDAGIRRLFRQYSRGLIQRWIRITDAAMYEHPRGFPGFRISPAAFLIDGIQNQRLPPDWIHAHDKERQRREWEAKRASSAAEEQNLRQQYEVERSAALQAYRTSPGGHEQFAEFESAFLEFYRAVEPHRFRDAAREAATGKVEREHLQFPEFGVWMLQHRQTEG